MSLKILKFEAPSSRLALVVIVAVCVILTWFFIRWNFVNAVAARGFSSKLPESRILADWVTTASPDDPQSHYAAAVLFEKTFEADDLTRSLTEYQRAVAASPYHYYFWLTLGRARDRNGDPEGAEKDFARALELAPHYSSVKWAYGNALLRHGKTDEGFAMIADAASTNPQFSNPAVSVALQIFEGDTSAVRRALGDSPEVNASLADILISQRLFREAVEAWSHLSADDKTVRFKDTGTKILSILNDAHQVRLATIVYGDIMTDAIKPVVGQITDGGFESGLKLRDAGLFEWQIGEGSDPKIGLSESTRRSGRYSLWLSFDSFEASANRQILQKVAVEPGTTYKFEGFYRADLKTKAIFKWDIYTTKTNELLGATEPMTFAGDWTTMSAKFTVPVSSDGIYIRLSRSGCGSGACPISGKMSFDDLSLTKIQE